MATCSTCRHFFAQASACRRYPPTVVLVPGMDRRLPTSTPAVVPVALFPQMSPDSVCGEHQVVEVA